MAFLVKYGCRMFNKSADLCKIVDLLLMSLDAYDWKQRTKTSFCIPLYVIICHNDTFVTEVTKRKRQMKK